MKRLHLVLFVASLGLSAVGCKKSIPEPWKAYDFPTENLAETDTGQLEDRLHATYKVTSVATLQAMGLLGQYGKKIEAQGFTKSCTGEYRYSSDERSFFDGYAKGDEKLGVVAVFSDKKLTVTVTKKFDTDVIYGGVLKNNCKPLK